MDTHEVLVLDALRAGRPLVAERAPADHTRRAWVRVEPLGGGRYRVRAFEIGRGRGGEGWAGGEVRDEEVHVVDDESGLRARLAALGLALGHLVAPRRTEYPEV